MKKPFPYWMIKMKDPKAAIFSLILILIAFAGCSKKNESKVAEQPKQTAETVEKQVPVEQPIATGKIEMNKDSMKIVQNEPVEAAKPEPVVACDNPAPDFSLSDMKGNTVSLSDFHGKVVILDFWATWCAPCRMEIPSFIKMKDQYSKQGLAVVGVSLDRNRAVVPGFAKKLGINYPILFGGRDISIAYGNIAAIPTTFIIDRDGCIKHRLIGLHSKDQFEALIKPLLDQKVAANKSTAQKTL